MITQAKWTYKPETQQAGPASGAGPNLFPL